MRTGIVFYSMNGNTTMVAEKLAKELPADLIEIKPEKTYPDKGFKKFLWGGKSAVMAETPELMPYNFSAGEYDLIVFGFPVWAGNVTPPIRTFVKEHKEELKGKRIAAFACQSGSGGEKAFSRLLECLGQEKLAATMILIDPKEKPKPDTDQKIEEFRGRLCYNELTERSGNHA